MAGCAAVLAESMTNNVRCINSSLCLFHLLMPMVTTPFVVIKVGSRSYIATIGKFQPRALNCVTLNQQEIRWRASLVAVTLSY